MPGMSVEIREMFLHKRVGVPIPSRGIRIFWKQTAKCPTVQMPCSRSKRANKSCFSVLLQWLIPLGIYHFILSSLEKVNKKTHCPSPMKLSLKGSDRTVTWKSQDHQMLWGSLKPGHTNVQGNGHSRNWLVHWDIRHCRHNFIIASSPLNTH